MLNLANIMTASRVILVPILWYIAFFADRQLFAILFIITGLTDALDGFFARHFKTSSKFGIWFDSFADHLVAFSLLPWIWLVVPEFFELYLPYLAAMFAFFMINFIAAKVIYKRMPAFHLYSNKVGAIAMYAALAYIFLIDINAKIFWTSYAIILYSFVEELVLILRKARPEQKKSMF